jgi:hypothetical protein
MFRFSNYPISIKFNFVRNGLIKPSLTDWLTDWLTVSVCLTDSVQQSFSSEANNHSDIQEISHILWDPKVHYVFTRPRLWPLS